MYSYKRTNKKKQRCPKTERSEKMQKRHQKEMEKPEELIEKMEDD